MWPLRHSTSVERICVPDLGWPAGGWTGPFQHLTHRKSKAVVSDQRSENSSSGQARTQAGTVQCHVPSSPPLHLLSLHQACGSRAGPFDGLVPGPLPQAPVGQVFLALGHAPVSACRDRGVQTESTWHRRYAAASITAGTCWSSSLGAPRSLSRLIPGVYGLVWGMGNVMGTFPPGYFLRVRAHR